MPHRLLTATPAVRLVGLGDGRLVEVEMELTHPVDGIAVFDLQGKMQYSNYPLAVSGWDSSV